MIGMFEAIIEQAAAGKTMLIWGVPGSIDTFGYTVNFTTTSTWTNWPKSVTVPA